MSAYEKALDLYETGSEDKVFELLLSSHSDGDFRATYALATWYLHGRFVRVDLKKAIKFLKLAAENHIADAQHDLAVSYEKGVGIEKNECKAFEFYLKAALNGDIQSIYEVGRCFYYGIGTEENRALAEIFLENADFKGVSD